MRRLFTISIVVIFVVLSTAFFVLKSYFPGYNLPVLETGNTIMATLSLITFFLVNRQLDSRAEAFVRGVYSASFLKLMVCMVAILVYVLLNREHIHKPSVFVLFGIYIIYTITETILLQRIVKE